MPTPLQDLPPFTGHAPPDEERPLGGYAIAMSVYAALTAAFVGWFRRSGRELPARVEPYDLALMTVATVKGSRIVTKDKITEPLRAPFTTYEGKGSRPAELSEAARGGAVRRSFGELLTCPHCLSVWVATALAAGLAVAPRATRWFAAVLTAVFGSDLLQAGYRRLSS